MIRSGALAASTMSESAEPLTVRRHSYPRSDQGGTRQEAVTAGEYLNWTDEEARYWFFRASDGLDRFRRLAFAHVNECAFGEIARSASGLPVYSFRMGKGSRPIVFISGMHGCEPSGPRGLLALLDALLGGQKPFNISVDTSKLLSAITLYVIPLINPGGAERYSTHFPDSWHGTWIPEWTEANKVRFMGEANQPTEYFFGSYVKKAPMRFSPAQIAQWEATGHSLGSSLTDDGLDMWFDWDDTRGRETAALKQLLQVIRPYWVVDFHNFMYPTEVFAPSGYSQASLAQEELALAASIHEDWRRHKLPFHDARPRPYPKPKEKHYEDYWFHELGTRSLIIEINGGMLATEGAEYEPNPKMVTLTRRESLESVLVAANAILNYVFL